LNREKKDFIRGFLEELSKVEPFGIVVDFLMDSEKRGKNNISQSNFKYRC